MASILAILLASHVNAAGDRLGDPLPDGAVQRLGTLRLRYGGISDLAYLPDGRAVIAYGTVIEIWDLAKGELQFKQAVTPAGMCCIQVRSDGKVLLIADGSGKVHEWDIEQGSIIRSFPTNQAGIKTAYYSPDEKRVLTTGGNPPSLKEFELETGKELISIAGNMHYFCEGIYGPDGKTAFVDGSNGSGPILAHFDLATGNLLNEWHKDYYAHSRSLVLSEDGERILAGTRHSATEWKIEGYELLNKFTGHHGHAVTAVAYCKDPGQLLTGSRDGSIRRWDRLKNEVLLRWCPHESHCSYVEVSPDGSRVLSYGGGMVTESRITDGTPTIAWERHSQAVEAAAVLPDGRKVISGSADASLRLWDSSTGECLRTVQCGGLGAYTLALAPDGSHVAAGCKDGVIREFSIADGKLLREFKGHRGYIRSLAHTPDGQRLLSSADDGRLMVWEPGNDQPVSVMKEHRGGVLSIAVSADGKFVLSGGRDGTVRLWDLQKAALARTCEGHRGWVQAVCFAGDNDHALSSGRDGRILKWNLQTGEVEAEMVHGGWVRALVCTPDGKTACAGGEDNLITCWDLATGEKKATFKGHQSHVLSLAFSPDGQHLVSGSQDSTLMVWAMP